MVNKKWLNIFFPKKKTNFKKKNWNNQMNSRMQKEAQKGSVVGLIALKKILQAKQ